MSQPLENHIWWGFIHEDLQELLRQSSLLLEIIGKREKKLAPGVEEFHDYAFVVFPAAKAYEGFLKTLFKDLGFIGDEEYFGKRFRIGKALNPSLEENLRMREGVYDKLVAFCDGKDLADTLWETWKGARNLLFHWFPNEKNSITFQEARLRIKMILDTMDLAYKECKIDRAVVS